MSNPRASNDRASNDEFFDAMFQRFADFMTQQQTSQMPARRMFNREHDYHNEPTVARYRNSGSNNRHEGYNEPSDPRRRDTTRPPNRDEGYNEPSDPRRRDTTRPPNRDDNAYIDPVARRNNTTDREEAMDEDHNHTNLEETETFDEDSPQSDRGDYYEVYDRAEKRMRRYYTNEERNLNESNASNANDTANNTVNVRYGLPNITYD
jgi:hypothetical protein